MYKKMMHDIRYVGKAGEINFSKEPYMYQDTDLFNYNLEYDLNYFPSGKGGKVKRFKQWPQVSRLTLGVINRVDVRELVSQLERHFQVDINAKIPAKLFINGSYTECYVVSSVKTFFNRFKGINFITFDILRENPVWTIEEEFSYIRSDMDIDKYLNNLIKPPYNFSEFEMPQPSKTIEEANLIPSGWDSFVEYGSGKNYVENWNFESDDLSSWRGYRFDNKIQDGRLIGTCLQGISPKTIEYINDDIPVGNYIFRIKGNFGKGVTFQTWTGANIVPKKVDGIGVIEILFTKLEGRLQVRMYSNDFDIGDTIEIDWVQITPIDNQHLVVEKTPLGNGLTRIQTWGGNHRLKMRSPAIRNSDNKGRNITHSLYVENVGNMLGVADTGTWSGQHQGVLSDGEKEWVVWYRDNNYNHEGRIDIWAEKDKNDNLDFIASDPVILENDGSFVYDLEETSLGKYRFRTFLSDTKTKLKYRVPKSIFRNEKYTHSLVAENKGYSDLIINAETGIYENDPFARLKPNVSDNIKFTGNVIEDNLYTTFEIGTENEEDNLDVIISKPAIREGEEAFIWPSDEEIVSLRIPTPIPFWITADDSIKYISNNSIGETMAKITLFGPINEPTLYIGNHTYRVHEELLENERIEIDQRSKTVIKITGSGERVNVFHLRDKEHSVFTPIPEGESSITQNDDFSYTIVLYNERNEPQWT